MNLSDRLSGLAWTFWKVLADFLLWAMGTLTFRNIPLGNDNTEINAPSLLVTTTSPGILAALRCPGADWHGDPTSGYRLWLCEVEEDGLPSQQACHSCGFRAGASGRKPHCCCDQLCCGGHGCGDWQWRQPGSMIVGSKFDSSQKSVNSLCQQHPTAKLQWSRSVELKLKKSLSISQH